MSEGRDGMTRVTIGALPGAAAASLMAPLIRPLFDVPTGGVGYVTIHHYPKGWEAMTRLRANPPDFVVLEAPDVPPDFDGIGNEKRVPELVQWIKANYPHQLQVGKFLVAAR